MSALTAAGIYFGSFIAVGAAAYWAVRRWVSRRDLDLSGVQADLGPRRGTREMFLLGVWRKEGPDT